MLPTIHLGSFQFSTYALMYALAFLTGGVLVLRRVNGNTPEDIIRRNSLILIVVAIFAGLFIPSVIESYIRSWITGQPPEPFHMRVYYALGFGIATGYLYLRKHRLSFLDLMDQAIPVFALAFCLARFGCLAAGCCGGAVTQSVIGMNMPDEYGVWAKRYPTQLMSAGFELFIFFGLSWLDAQRRKTDGLRLPAWLYPRGVIFFIYVLLFCIERFTLEFIRYDYHPVLGIFSLPHLLMLGGMLATLAGFWAITKKTQNAGAN